MWRTHPHTLADPHTTPPRITRGMETAPPPPPLDACGPLPPIHVMPHAPQPISNSRRILPPRNGQSPASGRIVVRHLAYGFTDIGCM